MYSKSIMMALLATLLLTRAVSADGGAPVPYSIEPLLTEVRTRQAELDRRERELDQRERSLTELEKIVSARLGEVREMRDVVDSRIAAWQNQTGKRIAQLAKIYASMPPANAAGLIDDLDANLATQILRKMKYKKSAAVLARVSRERALTVSRQVAHPLSFEPAKLDEGNVQ